MPTDDTAIRTHQLTVTRGRAHALDALDLTVDVGTITGLLGPSGCGKTTLMRTIVGTQAITSGTVQVFGIPAGDRSLRRRVGYVTQSPSVYLDLTVEENVRYFGALYDARADVDDALTAVGLVDYRRRRTADLSGGQRSRVSIACALVGAPELLVLDEPTVGLDPLLRVDLWRRFRALADAGTTLLVSSHVMDEAEHCDSLILMRDGRIVGRMTPEHLRAQNPQGNLEAAFVTLIERQAVS